MKLEIKSESQYHQIRLSHWKSTLWTPFYLLVYVCCKKAFCLLYQLFWIFDTCYLLTLGIFWQILLTNEFYDFFENDLSVLSDQGCVTMVSLMAMLVPGQLSLPLIIYTRTLFSSFQKVDGKYYR